MIIISFGHQSCTKDKMAKSKFKKKKKIVFNSLEKLRMSRAARQLRGKTRITFHEVGDLISFYVYCRNVFLFCQKRLLPVVWVKSMGYLCKLVPSSTRSYCAWLIFERVFENVLSRRAFSIYLHHTILENSSWGVRLIVTDGWSHRRWKKQQVDSVQVLPIKSAETKHCKIWRKGGEVNASVVFLATKKLASPIFEWS